MARETSRPRGVEHQGGRGAQSRRAGVPASRWCSASTSTWATPGTAARRRRAPDGWPGRARRRRRRTAAAWPARPAGRRGPGGSRPVAAGGAVGPRPRACRGTARRGARRDPRPTREHHGRDQDPAPWSERRQPDPAASHSARSAQADGDGEADGPVSRAGDPPGSDGPPRGARRAGGDAAQRREPTRRRAARQDGATRPKCLSARNGGSATGEGRQQLDRRRPADHTSAGSAVPTGRSPTSTEQHLEHLGQPGARRAARDRRRARRPAWRRPPAASSCSMPAAARAAAQ